MTPDELRERVVRAIYAAEHEDSVAQADAALRVVAEALTKPGVRVKYRHWKHGWPDAGPLKPWLPK